MELGGGGSGVGTSEKRVVQNHLLRYFFRNDSVDSIYIMLQTSKLSAI